MREWETFAGSNTPVVGATVNVRVASNTHPNAGSIVASTTTNASGMWEFTSLADAIYDVDITYNGRTRHRKGNSKFSFLIDMLPINVNALVNGDFAVWQRGTSFVSPASSAFNADRWQWTLSGAMVVTITRDTSVPTVGTNAINTPYSLKVDVTTADASIAAGDYAALQTAVEGYDYRPLTNGFTLSFWVKAAKTGTHCVAFLNRGFDRSYVAEYTVSVADTWEYKTITVPAPPTAGTWDYSTGAGLYIRFALAAGSTYQTTAGSWQTGFFMATSGQVNEMDNTANNFFVALVNLVPGAQAQVLQPIPYQQQHARCQRYCQVFGGDATGEIVGTGYCASTTTATLRIPFLVVMHSVPSLTVSAASDWAVVVSAAPAACTGLVLIANTTSTRGAGLQGTVASGLTAGQGAALVANGTANARLTFEANPT